MHSQGRKIPVDGATLHVEERGTPGGREILFLHGGLGTLDDWDSLIGSFDDCRVVLLDSRGHGASTLGAAALTYPLLADDAEAVIRAIGLTAPIIIGHSDGGITGLHLAARGTVPLAGLVTIGANGHPPDAAILARSFQKLTPEKWNASFPETVALYQSLNPEPDFDRFFEAVRMMWCNTAEGNFPGALLGAITCPSLILGGDQDHLVTRAETVGLADAIAGATLGVIPFGSHVPHWDHPNEITPLIRRFIGALKDAQP